MLNAIEVRNVISHISYKPGARFLVDDETGLSDIRITIMRMVPDVYRPNEKVLQAKSFFLDEYTRQDEDTLVRVLFHEVLQLEAHECAEWFKYKGKHHRNPHPELSSL